MIVEIKNFDSLYFQYISKINLFFFYRIFVSAYFRDFTVVCLQLIFCFKNLLKIHSDNTKNVIKKKLYDNCTFQYQNKQTCKNRHLFTKLIHHFIKIHINNYT